MQLYSSFLTGLCLVNAGLLIPASGQPSGRLTGHQTRIRVIALSPDNSILASGDIGDGLRIWDPKSRKSHGVLKEYGSIVSGLAFSADSKLLAVAEGKNVHV